jgi:hypothetical protein
MFLGDMFSASIGGRAAGEVTRHAVSSLAFSRLLTSNPGALRALATTLPLPTPGRLGRVR